MAIKILKFWHQWGWAYHFVWASVVVIAFVVTYLNAVAANTQDIKAINDQKLPERMATQEQAVRDIGDNIKEIKTVQGKIFDRINAISDKR